MFRHTGSFLCILVAAPTSAQVLPVVAAPGGDGTMRDPSDGASLPMGSVETFPGIGKRFIPATGADLPSVERFGITGDGSTADSARLQTALSAEGGTRTLWFKAKSYTFSGCYTSRGYMALRGLGQGDETSNPGPGPKIRFTGNCPNGYLSNANPAIGFYHAFFSGLTIIGAGTTPYIFDLRSCVACSFQDLTVYTTQVGSGFLRSRKISATDNSWNNKIVNVRVQIPDTAGVQIVDEDWSDSEVVSSHFTGGKGYMSRGYGVKYVANQFERSTRAGLTLSKETTTRNAVVIGNHFDANATAGVEFDVTRDVSTNYTINVTLVGNIYRTVNPNTGMHGSADILYTNPTANQYRTIDPVGEAHLIPEVLPYKRNTGSWLIVGTPAKLPSLPVYADNAAATAAGLNVGDQYRTANGVLMVRY